MTTITGQLKDDVHRNPRELEREADRAREDLERTLEQLEERISPNEILDRTLRVVKESGADFGRNLAEQVRSNPMPTILTGIGIAWLLSGGERHRAAGSASGGRRFGRGFSGHDPDWRDPDWGDPDRRDAGEAIRDAAGTAREAASDLASGAREAVAHAKSTARDAVDRATSSVQNAAHGVANASHSARARVASASQSVRAGYEHLSSEQPFVLGALAVAAGAALGALFPSTRAEDEWIGRFSDDATDRIREGAERTWESAKESVAGVAERAADEVERAASDATSTFTPEDSPDDTTGDTPSSRTSS